MPPSLETPAVALVPAPALVAEPPSDWEVWAPLLLVLEEEPPPPSSEVPVLAALGELLWPL
ncbi:hypothetical protein OSH10_22040 [Kaistia defluvii]|uniref:hypothetical protein n=1 Tax=Kaistia defluvii TaxID=410841 RepID=UPI0022550BB1|nr:hypothetical protein [Kaistia defluvii]MCX5521128.1 hypothetical protein [Kaistia defluvii]